MPITNILKSVHALSCIQQRGIGNVYPLDVGVIQIESYQQTHPMNYSREKDLSQSGEYIGLLVRVYYDIR